MHPHSISLITGGALAGQLFADLLAPEQRARDPQLEPLPAGTLVGAYEIEEPIGRGGGGTVYRASRADGRYALEVAVKVLSRSALPLDRAITECRALAQLSHPTIPKILDAGSLDDGRLWFAMELVQGQPVDQHFEQTNLSFDRRIEVVRQICEGFVVAHEAGVVHRDVKPSNLLVDHRGHPKIIDFGIASIEDPTRAPSAGQFLTPAWASPEQLRGEPTSPASDIYQLGLLLGRLLGETRTSPQDIGLRASKRNLAAVVQRATAHDVEARYATVRELSADLGRVAANIPVRARSWSIVDRLRFGWIRNTRLVVLVGVMSIALLSFFVQNRAAILETEQRASGAVSFIGELIQRADPARGDGTRASAVAILDEAARLLTEPGSLSDRDRLSLATRVVNLYVDLEEGAAGAALARSVFASRTANSEANTLLQIELQAALASALLSTGDADGAVRVLDQAQSQAASLSQGEKRGANQLLKVTRAGVAVTQSRYDDANRMLREYFDDAATLGAKSQENLVLALNLSGVIQTYSAPDAAAEQFIKARDLAVGLKGSCSYCAIINDVGAAQAVSESRDYERARDFISRAHAEANRYMTRNGVNHKVLSYVYRAEAEVLIKQGDRKNSEVAIDRAIDHLSQYDGASPDLAKMLITSGRIARDDGRQEDALSDFRRAVQVATDAGARASPFDLLAALNESAKSELALDRPAAALETATAMEATLRSIPAADDVWTCAVLLTVARAQMANGQRSRAADALDEIDPHLAKIAPGSARRKSYDDQVRDLRAALRNEPRTSPAR